MKKENDFQASLIKDLEKEFPDSIILKNDPNYLQGIQDILILEKGKWALLETKRSSKSKRRPNQDYYVDKAKRMSYSKFVEPENKEETIDELKKFFQ